jgi:hypothetical protein
MLPPGDEHDFTKNLIDNLGKFIAALSFALLTVTVLHDWGYFWLLGSRFQCIQTPYDYLANAIEWLPLHLALFLLALLCSFVLQPLYWEVSSALQLHTQSPCPPGEGK